jgi:Glyoxalase-like domain
MLQRLDDGDGPVRMHLDLASENRDAEVERHEGLGGRVVRRTEQWTTLLDPSGRAYCVTRRNPVSGAIG